MVGNNKLKERRQEETKGLLEELYNLYQEAKIPSEKIALECKVKNNTVERWFRNLKKGQPQALQAAQMYFVKKFLAVLFLLP